MSEIFNPFKISPDIIDSLVSSFELIDKRGVDSLVFQCQDWVIYQYYPNLSLPVINLYRDIVELCAQRAHRFSRKLWGWGQTDLAVNQKDHIIQSSVSGTIYGFSGYVNGVRGRIGVDEGWDEFLADFTQSMRGELGYNAIDVTAYNTKMLKGTGSKNNLLVATDVCRRICDLTLV